MIKVQESDFNVGEEISRLTADAHHIGGIVTFIGLVRAKAGEKDVDTMALEHYPGMTEQMLKKIEAEANSRWPLDASLIIHRYGPLKVGEQIVLVITASAHRQAAFEANQFLVDWLKTKAPFWKKETGPQGVTWVESRDEDDKAAARWADISSK